MRTQIFDYKSTINNITDVSLAKFLKTRANNICLRNFFNTLRKERKAICFEETDLSFSG